MNIYHAFSCVALPQLHPSGFPPLRRNKHKFPPAPFFFSWSVPALLRVPFTVFTDSFCLTDFPQLIRGFDRSLHVPTEHRRHLWLRGALSDYGESKGRCGCKCQRFSIKVTSVQFLITFIDGLLFLLFSFTTMSLSLLYRSPVRSFYMPFLFLFDLYFHNSKWSLMQLIHRTSLHVQTKLHSVEGLI